MSQKQQKNDQHQKKTTVTNNENEWDESLFKTILKLLKAKTLVQWREVKDPFFQ